jgi:dTDP-N-acetylfucosamine:lipid II N-acetylfucosaminyltransferase
MNPEATNHIVHIATDEKFIDAAYDIYEKAFHGMNLFLILKREGEDIKYLNKTYDYNFIITNTDYVYIVNKICHDAKIIVFHGMNYFQSILVNKINKGSKKYVWTPFGVEVYNNNLIILNESVGPKTYKLFINNYKKWVKDIFRPFFYWLFKGTNSPESMIKKSFLKMDFVCILFEEELMNYFMLGIVNSNLNYIKFTYYPLRIIIKNGDFVYDNNILLGNSASYTNNHLEAFEILEKFDLKNFKIITPLSYGSKEYADKIVELGKNKFGNRFYPLMEYKTIEEYQKILQGCGIVFMNHSRTQATGNILTALFLGAKVFMSEKTTMFHYLKRIKCHVFSIENELIIENNDVFNLLTTEQMTHNRAVITNELSLDRLSSELRDKLSPLLLAD